MSPTICVIDGAGRNLSLQTGMTICNMNRRLSVTSNHVSHLFPGTFLFLLFPPRIKCGALLLKVTVYERTQKSPSPCCSAAQAPESFLLKAVGATRQLFLSFFFVKKQSNQTSEHLLSLYPIKSPHLLIQSVRRLLSKHKAAIGNTWFAYAFFVIKA